MTPYRSDDSREPFGDWRGWPAKEYVERVIADCFGRGKIVVRAHIPRDCYARLFMELGGLRFDPAAIVGGMKPIALVGAVEIYPLPPGETVGYMETVDG